MSIKSPLKIRKFDGDITHYRLGPFRLTTYADGAWTVAAGQLMLSWKDWF